MQSRCGSPTPRTPSRGSDGCCDVIGDQAVSLCRGGGPPCAREAATRGGEQCDGDEVAEGGLRPVHVSGAVEPGGVGKKDDAGGSEGRVEMASKEASGASAAAARGQVVGDFGEVDELAREGAEAVDVGEVRRESERGADGAAGGKPDRLDVVVDRHCLAELAADERFARDREGDLTGAGVAEAAGSERDVVLSRNAIDVALVDDPSVGGGGS